MKEKVFTKLKSLQFVGSTPIGEFDSKIKFSAIDKSDKEVDMIYMPVPVDGYYFTQGNNPKSLASLINKFIVVDSDKIPVIDVIRCNEKGSKDFTYGFIQAVEKKTDKFDKTSYLKYSKIAGRVAAMAYFAGISNLYLNKVVGTEKGPVVNGKMAFTANTAFKVVNTGLFNADKGAFASDSNISLNIDHFNEKKIEILAPIKFKNFEYAQPEKKAMAEGFKQVLDIVKDNKNDFTQWATDLSKENIITRINIQQKKYMKSVRTMSFLPKRPTCRDLIYALQLDVLSTNAAAISILEGNCKHLLDGLPKTHYGITIPGFYLRYDQKKMYYPDYKTTTHLDVKEATNLLEPGKAGSAKIKGTLMKFRETDETSVFPQSSQETMLSRFENIDKNIKTLDSELKELVKNFHREKVK